MVGDSEIALNLSQYIALRTHDIVYFFSGIIETNIYRQSKEFVWLFDWRVYPQGEIDISITGV